jgi:hypothetical protein
MCCFSETATCELILRRFYIDEHTEPFHLQPDLVMLFNSWPTKLCIGMVKDALSTRVQPT